MKCDNGCIVVKYKWNGPDLTTLLLHNIFMAAKQRSI